MKKLFLSAFLLAAASSVVAGTLTFYCSTDKKDGIYKVNEKIVFTATLKEDGAVPKDKTIRYRLYHGSKIVKRGQISAKETLKIETSGTAPNWIRLAVWAYDAKGKAVKQKNRYGSVVAYSADCGAMVSPYEITPTTKEPEDFDKFWQDAKKELAAVPVEVREMKEIPDKELRIYDVKISCAGDKPVSGILCIPRNAKSKSAPAVISFHGAGVHSASPDRFHAQLGAITFNVNAHGIENGKPKEFYQNLRKTYYYTTQDEFRKTRYALWNKHDRNKYYMRGMYIRVLRALEYVKTLPEWDGKHLAVTGGSQGGTQTLVAAALDKDVTFARAGVPGWCDLSGVTEGRQSGGGLVYTLKEAESNPSLVKNVSYFDCMFLAKRIKCPIYINTGFVDTVCSPSSVFAAYNLIPATTEKHLQLTPAGGHGTAKHTQGLAALAEYVKKVVKKDKAK
ncbi:MAG: acetylxylan esterase [Lentisphaeria bacterium]|nr:acetylxylan esterase [Lentisphaeria bacterium]